MSDDAFNWINDELRRVPLPEGLQARLRRAMRLGAGSLSDSVLDAAMNDVILPDDLLASLGAIVDDEQLDERLCDVPTPVGLLDELEAIPQDEQLCDVAVPVDLLLELRRIPPQRKRRLPAAQLALAVSLLMMITLGYAASIAGLVMSAYDHVGEPYSLFVVNRPGLELISEVHPHEALAIEFPATASVGATAPVSVPWHDPHEPAIDSRSIADTLAAELSNGYSLSDSRALIEYEILGQPHTAEDRTPDLQWLGGIEQRGIQPPIALGFDRQFLITKRTNPIVPLRSIRQLDEDSERDLLLNTLRHNRLPLWSTTESFDELRHQVAVGRLPAARRIHVEDFIAAMDFGYEKPGPGKLGIRAYAGPSVFGEDRASGGSRALVASRASLMQVGVQAGLLAGDDDRPAHVTLAIDTSDSMKWQSRLEIVRTAVRDFSRLLRPEDCLSLIVFDERAHVLLEDIAGDDRQALSFALATLRPSGGTNLLAGLQYAVLAADGPVASRFERRHVLLVSDGMPSLPPQASTSVAKLLAVLDKRDIDLHIFAIDGASGDDVADSQEGLRELAALAGEDLTRCNSLSPLNEHLCRCLIGTSPVLARDATLTVSFNPQSVRAYRLLGHEATTAGGTMSAEVKSTLLAGQAATALFEVWLEPKGPQKVASVRVDWVDADGQAQSAKQLIARRQFSTSWRASALQLQAAIIAAEAAEVLRDSPFIPIGNGNRDLRKVLKLAEQVNSRLAERESFQQFVRVLRQAEATRRGLPVGG